MSNDNDDKTLVRYGEFNPQAAAEFFSKEAATRPSRFVGKLAVGRTVIRIMPPVLGKTSPIRSVWQHSFDFTGEDGKYQGERGACNRVEVRKPCLVCVRSEQLKVSQNPVDQQRGRKLEAQAKYYANVIVRGREANGVKVWEFGFGIMRDLKTLFNDPDAGGNWSDPSDNGYDIVVVRSGTTKHDTEYTVLSGKNCALSADGKEMNEWLRAMHDLDKEVYLRTDDDWRSMLAGKRPDRDARRAGGAPHEQAPSPRSAVRPSTTADEIVHGSTGDDDLPY
jgi:hypothetical protein